MNPIADDFEAVVAAAAVEGKEVLSMRVMIPAEVEKEPENVEAEFAADEMASEAGAAAEPDNPS